MTAHQTEQVTPPPRIYLKHTNQETRTWQQPRIRLHDSVQSTPLTVREPFRSHHFTSTRVRVTAPSHDSSNTVSAPLRTTPVTHPAIPKPPRFRIAGAKPESNNICRQLFTNATPAKRPRHSTPSFRFSCGRERTQPSPNRGRNHLIDALDAQVNQAERNLRIFRNGLSNTHPDNSFQTAISEGMLFEVSRWYRNLLVLKPHPYLSEEQSIEFAVVLTDDMLSDEMRGGGQIDYSRNLVYIPYPWHAQVVDGFNFCCSRVLIAAHKVHIFRKEHLTSLENLTVNTVLDTLPLPEQIVPCHREGENSGPEVGFRFAALSPHVTVTNLSVFVDFYEPSHQLAIIRDDTGELAVLVTRCAEIEASSTKWVFNGVSILPHRVSSHVILEGMRDKGNEGLYHRVAVSGHEKSFLVFKLEEISKNGAV